MDGPVDDIFEERNYFYIVVKFHVRRSNSFGDMTKTRKVGKLTKNDTIEKIVDVCACPD